MDQETREQFRKMDKRLDRFEDMLSTLIQIVGATNARLEEAQAEFRKENASLRTEFKKEITDFRAEIKKEFADFRVEVKQENADFRAEIKQEIADFRVEVKQENADFRAEIKQEIADFRKEFISTQERQDRILEILSLKSIETDAYLHDFKRRLQIS